MALLTKITKLKGDYHQWSAGELNNGDIIDVLASLGRSAHAVTIESLGGATSIRFNVGHFIRKNQGSDNSWMADSEFWTKPGIIDEIEQVKDDIIITAESTQIWLKHEICITDIKIITKSSGLKITIA